MVYLFKVYALVTVLVFGFGGSFALLLFGLQEAKDYVRARVVMQRIASGRVANFSRIHEESHEFTKQVA